MKPKTAVSLLLGIVAACVLATAVLAVVDATRPPVMTPSVTQPSVAQPSQSFVIPDDPPGGAWNVSTIQSADHFSSVTVITSRSPVASTKVILP